MEPCRLFSPASKSKAFVHSSGTYAGELGFVGFLDVLVHKARDINNSCIYHEQVVYAKLCLTSDPNATVSTRTINGGLRNLLFDETLRLGVRTVASSLKCEIWMLSKAKSYLEDQLLGFALVPLADILVADGKLLAQDFSLSSTDLFRSPTGFIQLSLSYAGASPEAMALLPAISLLQDAFFSEIESPCEHKKIEFKNLKFAVSSSGSTSDSSSASVSPNANDASPKFAEGEADSWTMNSTIKMIDIEPEQTVVQQDIVDMYTKSMQQSLTDMKLPAVVDGYHSTISRNANVIFDDRRSPAEKRIGPRVFYGNRAFF